MGAATDNGQQHVPTVEAAVINDVAQRCWQTSEDHGFHDDWEMAAWLEKLADNLSVYEEDGEMVVADYDAEGFPGGKEVTIGTGLKIVANVLRTNILGMKLMLTVSELSEGLEALRSLGADGLLDPTLGDPDKIRNWGEELADAQVRIGDLSGMTKVNLGDEQIAKMKVNEGRPHKHGRVV